jgi:outer membrane lipoprotein LolB
MRLFLVLVALLLAACAAPPKLPPSEQPQWSGRLSIKIDADPSRQKPEQQTSAGFTLVGNAAAGQLDLFTPLGGKAAQVVWTPQSATISNGNVGRNFPDLATALREVTGADIPTSSLFDWLQGKQDKALGASMGWEADLTRLSEGRIVAIRPQPLPRIELRIVLEQ